MIDMSGKNSKSDVSSEIHETVNRPVLDVEIVTTTNSVAGEASRPSLEQVEGRKTKPNTSHIGTRKKLANVPEAVRPSMQGTMYHQGNVINNNYMKSAQDTSDLKKYQTTTSLPTDT